MKRDEAWLQSLLDKIWDRDFPDVQQANDVRIKFGRKAKRRLGAIALDPADRRTSIITINPLFKRPDVPEFVAEGTIFHELTHYAHGFNSPLAQAQRHPHAGGVMRREYAERGQLELYLTQKRWLKFHWPRIVAEEFPSRRRGMAVQVRRLWSGQK
ncbi:MAG TPA: hypothetical protein VI322_01375 [Candidatus Saccharimonadia bacterium]